MNGSPTYSLPAIGLHWITALLIAGAFLIGGYAVDLQVSPLKLKLFSWHKWLGVTILLLTLARIAWRLYRPPPPLPAGMPRWERLAAASGHGLLYLLLLAVPVSGWLLSSAAGFPVVYFGVLQLPDLVARNRELAETLKTVHYWLNTALLALIAVHVAAALKHYFLDRDTVLTRMLPFLAPRSPDKET